MRFVRGERQNPCQTLVNVVVKLWKWFNKPSFVLRTSCIFPLVVKCCAQMSCQSIHWAHVSSHKSSHVATFMMHLILFILMRRSSVFASCHCSVAWIPWQFCWTCVNGLGKGAAPNLQTSKKLRPLAMSQLWDFLEEHVSLTPTTETEDLSPKSHCRHCLV